MKFLTVLIIVFLYRHWIGENPVRRFVNFDAYARWMSGMVKMPRLRFAVTVGLPLLLVFLIAVEIDHWLFGLFWLALSLVVLVYAMDVNDLEVLFNEQAEWLQGIDATSSIADLREQHEDFKLFASYEVFQGLYPALFWFLLLGPTGALAYVLTRQYFEFIDDEDPEIELVDQVIFWLEWPAARVTGLIYALIGRFGRTFDEWLQTLGDTHQAIGSYLVRLASVAGDGESTADNLEAWIAETRASNDELKEMLDRTLFGWLALATVLVIVGV